MPDGLWERKKKGDFFCPAAVARLDNPGFLDGAVTRAGLVSREQRAVVEQVEGGERP